MNIFVYSLVMVAAIINKSVDPYESRCVSNCTQRVHVLHNDPPSQLLLLLLPLGLKLCVQGYMFSVDVPVSVLSYLVFVPFNDTMCSRVQKKLLLGAPLHIMGQNETLKRTKIKQIYRFNYQMP